MEFKFNHNNNNKLDNNANFNIASSWPAIINDHVLDEAAILPHLLHEASEEASAVGLFGNGPSDGTQMHQLMDAVVGNEENSDEQLQNMIENYRKHVIGQKQQNTSGNKKASTGRSASNLQRKINAPQPTMMSHSQPCLISTDLKVHEESKKKSNHIGLPHQHQHVKEHSDQRKDQPNVPFPVICNGNQYRQAADDAADKGKNYMGNLVAKNEKLTEENGFLKKQIEKLQKKCEKLEQLEGAYGKIEREYEQMQSQHERREDLGRVAIQKLEQQLRILSAENEQMRAQNNKLMNFGQQMRDGESEQQVHFLLNELIPKNNELLMVQERQRMELDAQSTTLEEQRTHIDVLEKALSNAQERLAAKERSAIDAVAVLDKCSHLQRMLQEALEDKQRQKEDHGRQMAQLEKENTQMRLQIPRDNPQALGSLGRKGGAVAVAGTGPESTDEIWKLRKSLGQKDARISQLETSLLELQRQCGGLGEAGQGHGLGRMRDLEGLAMRLEMEKAEKDRRIQELLDEKMRIQMQWAEERRSLDIRVRLLEKDLRHFVGSQSSLASSGGAVAGVMGTYGADLSPFASVRGEKSYSKHRSTAELPTSARGAAFYEERDVIARVEDLGRKLIGRKGLVVKGTERTVTVQRPSELGLIQVPAEHSDKSSSPSAEQLINGTDISPCSEDYIQTNGSASGTLQQRQQSGPSSTSSSTKKRYFVNNQAQLNAYLEQLPEGTRRRLANEKLMASVLMSGVDRNGSSPAGGCLTRREGGCRRLIRDHSTDARKAEGTQVAMAPPPAYPLRQMHQMTSIEEPLQEPPAPPPSQSGRAVNVVQVTGEEGDSDTLTGHRQLVFRRSSLGNANLDTDSNN